MTKKVTHKKATTRRTDKIQIPVDFNEAVRALLSTPPPPKPTKRKATNKKRTTKKH